MNFTFSQEYNVWQYSSQNGLASSKTSSLAQDSEGYLWIGTPSGLSRFDGNSFTNFDRFDGLKENVIIDLYYSKNKLFIKHNDSVFSVMKDNKFKVSDTFPNYRKKQVVLNYNFLKNKKVNASLIDQENTLWIATAKNGLLGLPLENFPIYTWNNLENLKNVYQNTEKEYLLTYSNAIGKLNFRNSKPYFKSIFTSNNKEFTCALIQNKTELWYGTDKGLFLYFTNFSIGYSFKELKNKNINSIEKLENGNILISADNELYEYDKKSNSISKYESDKFLKTNSLLKINNIIYALAKGNVLEVNGDSKKLIFPFERQYNEVTFSHLFIDKDNNYWISSIEKGIYFKNNKTGKISHFSKEKNLNFKTIHSSYVKDNILWMVSNIGTIKYDIINKSQTVFSDKYFNNIDFVSGLIKNNENYYFTSNKGIVSIFNSNEHKKKCSDLKIKRFSVSGKSRILDSVIQISHKNFPIEIEYHSVSLKDKIYYQYKLKDFDENWSNPTLQSSASFSNLPAGKYTFLVKTVSILNNTTIDENNISFIINIPFWKTQKFIYLTVAIIASVVLFFYLTRLIRLRKQKRKLQKLVEEKTYELSVQKQNIEQFSYSLSHDLKNPINNIKGLVEILNEESENNPEILKMLEDSTENLESKIKNTLNSIQRMQENKKETKNLSFYKVFSSVKKSLLLLIKQNNVEFITHLEVEKIKFNPSILESIFYNLISNSIKYKSPKRKAVIEISTKQEKNFILLTIKDNGLGFDLEKNKEALFSIFERVHTHKKGSGIGLYMIKQMVELNGGNLEVESKIDVGTTFFVRLKQL